MPLSWTELEHLRRLADRGDPEAIRCARHYQQAKNAPVHSKQRRHHRRALDRLARKLLGTETSTDGRT